MDKKRYFLVFCFVVAVVLGSAALISYVEDPGGVFTNGVYERGIADIVLSGHNVVILQNFDERLFQKTLIQEDTRQVDMAVLGSSRAQYIHSPFPRDENQDSDQVFVNNGVSGATLEDDIAILDLYLQTERLPKTIIIGVDPWIFNANNSQKRWTTLRPEYNEGRARFNGIPLPSDRSVYTLLQSDIDRYTSLISQPIVVKSIEKIFTHGSYYQTDSEEANEPNARIISKDGSHITSAQESRKPEQQVEADAAEYANSDPLYSLGNFTQIDENYRSQFESTIYFLKGRNVTVILLLPPYHPLVYERIVSDPSYSNVLASELYLRNLSSENNIRVFGSYNPRRLNLSSRDFYDGMHLRREVISSLIAQGIVGKKDIRVV